MERDKALEMALGQIEKQFGKGAVMRMGEESRVKIASIPTGALSLDLALGIGGLPRGRVVEIYGPESSGKCLPADTYVWTDRGLETVAELFERCGQKTTCTSRTTDVRHVNVRAVNEQGELEQVAALTHNNERPVLRVRLKSGRTISATHNHPLRVVNERGFIVWREAGRIQPGDTVVSAAFGAVEAAAGDGLTEDEGVLLGYLVAEGSLSDRNTIRFTNCDKEVGGEFTGLMEQVFGASVRCYDDKEYAVFDTALRAEFAERYGLDYVDAGEKKVPHCVRTAGHKAQRAFLSALFEGDGWIDPSSTVGLGTASEQVAREVQLLLYGLGIPVTVAPTWNQRHQRDYWTVTINAAVVHRFLAEVGFRSARRRAQVEANFHVAVRDPQFENIPHLAGLLRDLRADAGDDRAFDRIVGDLFRKNMDVYCSRGRLRKLLAWIDQREQALPPTAAAIVSYLRTLADAQHTYERVEAVEDGGLRPTFDLMLPETHSFLANGVLSHNTTVALHAVAEAQKAGGIAAFIDAEHALDPSYAAALGVDVEALLVSQPDTGEQGLEIADMLIRSGAIDVVVIDSVAALTPRAEIEGEMGDTHVGLQARLMSQALRKLAGTLNRSRTCAIFINQLREKIGVMFGCFEYDTRVTLADGKQEKIGKIVNQRLAVEVLSYDAVADAVVPKKITNWFDNGRTEEFLQFTVARGCGNGRAQFACTPNHLVRTPGGWQEAQELLPGDRVMQTVTQRLSEAQWEVLLGGLMGDSALSPIGSGHGALLRWGHGAKQVEYADWKASLFANIGTSRSTNAKGEVIHSTPPLPELAELPKAVYSGGKTVLSWDYIKRLTPLSLAVWYMDDGRFTLGSKSVQEPTGSGSGRSEICVEAIEASSRQRIVEYLRDEWGIEPKLLARAGKAVLQFPTAETAKLHELLAPYVHPSMDYKLLPRFRGQCCVEPEFIEPRQVIVPMPIQSIVRRPPTGPQTHRFDIEVEGTHNYFVDHVMVHNSPETTPGGRALKFYSSVRLDVRRIESLKDGTDVVGNRVRVKVVKNKCLAAGTQVLDPTTGLTHAIEDIVEAGAGSNVWAVDKQGRLHVRPITARLNQGQQQVLTIALRDRTRLRVTPDHRILTEHGWREARELRPGDRVARPRVAGRFGSAGPVAPDHARLLGYLIGDGSVGGGQPDPAKLVPPAFFAEDVSADVLGNLLFGLFESNGWIGRDQGGGIRAGFASASSQLAQQIHWLLLRWGITNAVGVQRPRARGSMISGRAVAGARVRWDVRIRGVENLARFARAIPTWGPRGTVLQGLLGQGLSGQGLSGQGLSGQGLSGQGLLGQGLLGQGLSGQGLSAAPVLGKERTAPALCLSSAVTESVLAHLAETGVTAITAAAIVSEAAGDRAGERRRGLRQVLGASRLRRDRVERLAEALDSTFLRDILADELYYDPVVSVSDPEWAATYDLGVEEFHNLVADDVVVHNCAPPFRQAEFDIMYGEGISREGSILDVGVDNGIIKKAGAWYTYDGEQLGQGRENARQFLKEHTDVVEEIYKKVTEQLGLVPTDVTGDDALTESESEPDV